jgi:hypothetical protein
MKTIKAMRKNLGVLSRIFLFEFSLTQLMCYPHEKIKGVKEKN